MAQMSMDARHEIKLVAPESEYHHLLQWFRIHSGGFVETYPARRINNVYFDTPDYAAYAESLAGVSSKAKVRFRWYGTSALPDSGRLEVKVKRNLLGRKIVYPIDAPLSGGMTWREIICEMTRRLPWEGKRWLHAYCQPAIVNRYTRHYWAAEQGDVRATVDVNHRVYDQRYKPHPNVAHPANMSRSIIVEVKCAREHSRLAEELMKGLPLVVSRNSKYCSGVRAVQDH